MDRIQKFFAAGIAAVALTAAAAEAAPIGVDGSIGAEWTGATVKTVLLNPTAPTGNFGTPTNENHASAYNIYTRGDGNYVYVGLEATGPYPGGLDFANLYFDTNPGTGSDIGFQVTNQNAFIPGVDIPVAYTPGTQDIHYSTSNGVVEFAVPNSYFTTDPMGMGFAPATTSVQLRLSQAFGYSVAGGTSYGSDRLGIVAVPEPTGIALLGLGAGALLLRRRRNVA